VNIPQLNGHYEVVHHTELISLLIAEGRLTLQEKVEGSLTYHDPCYLGRHNQVYSAPREVLTWLGFDISEMPRNRERSFCCGAGGGRMWTEETLGTRINQERMSEAVATNAETLAVACPFCTVMLDDAGADQSVQVKDVAQLVLHQIKTRQ